MSKFNQCLTSGKYEYVSPSETCTIATAKKLGIFNEEIFFSPEYQETKTFNAQFDNGRVRTAQLCKESTDASVAYPACQIEFGPAFTRRAGSANSCVVVECPPNFTKAPDGLSCVKPQESNIISKTKRCDERFYDWYTIPNYHLGNGYTQEKDICYAPCGPQQVPFRKRDPIDLYRSTIVEEPDQLQQCIHKQYYMSARYDNTPEYSPLAWLKRLTTPKETLEEEWLKHLKASNIDPKTPYLATRIRPHVEEIYKVKFEQAIPKSIEDLYKSGKHYEEAAAFQLQEDTHAFQEKAASICAELKEDEKAFAIKYRQSFPKLTDQEFDLRMKLLKQSCHLCFCKTNKLCFDYKPFLKEEYTRENVLTHKAKREAKNNRPIEEQLMGSFQRALYIFLVVIFVPIAAYLVWLLIRRIIYGPDRLMQFYKENLRKAS